MLGSSQNVVPKGIIKQITTIMKSEIKKM